MNIAILGTGGVAQTIAPKLAGAGHRVVLGSRDPRTTPAWVAQSPDTIEVRSHDSAASSAQLVINAVPGAVALDVLGGIAASSLDGKVVMDLTNAVVPADGGFALVYPESSLGEELQRALPAARVVKAMNTMSTAVIADPTGLSPQSSVFVSGDAADAKEAVTGVLRDLGWPQESIIDLGGIASARGPEHVFLLLAGLFGALGTPRLGLAVVR
jgi:8-hydroxy-5-deazaflavin:NADPH oxidoreductase